MAIGKIGIALLLGMYLSLGGWAQTIEGHVSDRQDQPLAAASVSWLGQTTGTLTDSTGYFNLPRPQSNKARLVVRLITYKTDTFQWKGEEHFDVSLQTEKILDDVVITGNAEGAHISRIDPEKTEIINELELGKAACCDLGGCFETQTTVEPTTTNVLTNAKELRILGLSGVYNQVLMDGFPTFYGLHYTYGISSVPGPLVKTIFVAKGANSVLQGYEGMVGQINVITKEPRTAERLFLNLYANSFGETQYNAHYAIARKKWANILSAHVATPAGKIDRDGDQFLDVPKINRYHVFNKWTYGNDQQKGLYSMVGLRYLNERRQGGQAFFLQEQHLGDTLAYGQYTEMERAEGYTKTGYRFTSRHQLAGYLAASTHAQEAWFGALRYTGRQKQLYANLQHEWRYGTLHNLKWGTSLRVFELDEQIAFFNDPLNRTYGGNYYRKEVIPGVFAENKFEFLEGKVTWMAGARWDYHNQFGSQFTPRTLVKANIGENGSLRANIGWGWRTVNLWAENITLLASSRDVILAEPLQPEKTLNYGVNYTHSLELENLDLTFTVDLYRTEFANQIFPDYFTAGIATISNFGGESVSNGFQAEVMADIFKVLNVRVGYAYLDVYRMIGGEKSLLPFNSKHKINGAFSIMPAQRKWHFDGNVHWFGPMRMATTADQAHHGNGETHFSPGFMTANGQFTWSFKRLDLYGGCENILDFRQLRPIVGYQTPFGPEFDTANVWGPTRGREFYIGIRYAIPAKTE